MLKKKLGFSSENYRAIEKEAGGEEIQNNFFVGLLNF